MFKPTADKKGLIELSIKQRDQWLNYQFDKARAEWPQLAAIPEEKPVKHGRQQSVCRRRVGSE